MSNVYNTLAALCQEHGITGYRMCKEVGIQPSIMTDLKMGRRKGVSAETADKIATYFGVSVGYLIGTEQKENPPTVSSERNYPKEYDLLNESNKAIVDRLIADLAEHQSDN